MNATKARPDTGAADAQEESTSEPAEDRPEASKLISHLLWFFALVYIVEGLGQVAGGLIS